MSEPNEVSVDFKESNFIVMPGWVVNDENLSLVEMVVYSIILGFSQDGNSMFMGTTGYIAKACRRTRQRTCDILSGLVKKGYIEKIEYRKGNVVKPCYVALCPKGVIEIKNPLQRARPEEETNQSQECTVSSPTNKSTTNRPKPSTRKPFVPPTRDELIAYMKEKNLHFRVDKFFEWYESSNWHDTKGEPVKDWKARARAWSLRGYDLEKPRSGATKADIKQLAEIAAAQRRREDDRDVY